MIGGMLGGFDRIWTWQFLVAFLALSVILGQIVKAFVGVLVLRDDTLSGDQRSASSEQ